VKPATLWPLAVIGALVVTVAANMVLLFAANDPRHAVVEPDYYRKAVAWDSTMAQEARDDSLGWSISADLAPAAGGALVHARVVDRHAVPVSGARISVVGIHNLDAGNPIAGGLSETAPGEYAASLPLRRTGLWELRFRVEYRSDRFTADLRRELIRKP